METSNELFDPSASFPDLDSLDDRYPPSATFCPLPADSSQLRAVFAAAEGRTFVLQGPPGTGKSQTITNLIAHCLTIGKRVLFVAQKRAALDVVHKRLADVGLGPFCLELHSNKTTKESFRVAAPRGAHRGRKRAERTWEAETSRLAELRRGLNEYVHDLHQPRAFGKSAYWVISRLIGRREASRKSRWTLAIRTGGRRRSSSGCGPPCGSWPRRRESPAIRLVTRWARSGSSNWIYGIEDDAKQAIQAAEEAHRRPESHGRRSILPDLGLGIDEASALGPQDRERAHRSCWRQRQPSPRRSSRSRLAAREVRADRVDRAGPWMCRAAATLLETYAEGLFSLDLPR